MKRVAMGVDLSKALDSLPKNVRAKVLKKVTMLMMDPGNQGLNYESINNAADRSFRSIRLDDTYRMIISEQDNYYIMLWVDHHDEAYEWAKNRVFNIDKVSGALELLEIKQKEKTEEELRTLEEERKRKERNRKRKLDRNGSWREEMETVGAEIPESFDPDKDCLFGCLEMNEMMDLFNPLSEDDVLFFRGLKNDDELLKWESPIRQKYGNVVYDMLFDLACGDDCLTVKDRYLIDHPASTDIEKALHHPVSQQSFRVVGSTEEMEEALLYPLEKWRVYLHPSQRRIVEKTYHGPTRVSGGAGTGKTVVAMHRAKRLASECKGEEMVFFTTFTKNLAKSIRMNLETICTPEEMNRIKVLNLDAWANEVLEGQFRQGIKPAFAEPNRIKNHWGGAVQFCRKYVSEKLMSDDEVKKEWHFVIQAQDIETEAQYLRASRLGRRIRLTPIQKKALWRTFEEYRALLKDDNMMENDDIYRTIRRLIDNKKLNHPYRYVIVDEAQDLSAGAFKLLKAIVEDVDPMNNLFIVGDAHQRIYGRKVVLGRCGIDIRGRSQKLRINYRTTEETKQWAVSVLEGCRIEDLDGGDETLKGYRSLIHGELPLVKETADRDAELDAIVEYLKSFIEQDGDLQNVCLTARTKKALDDYETVLSKRGIRCRKLGADQDKGELDTLNLATMHRVKGIEFDYMILAGMSADRWEKATRGQDDTDTTMAKSLIHVAATRARRAILVTSGGKMTSWVKK